MNQIPDIDLEQRREALEQLIQEHRKLLEAMLAKLDKPTDTEAKRGP